MALSTLAHAGKALPTYLVTGLTATGSGQSTAYQLENNTLHEFTTVGSSTAVILPLPIFPSVVSIYNAGSNTLSIYPAVGGTITGGSVNASVSLSAGSGATYWASSATNWYSLQTAAGSSTSPGGSTNQLQYDNAGSFGGTTDVGFDATNSCLQLTAISDPSANAGDLWLSSTTGSLVVAAPTGNQRTGGEIYRCGACSAITNTTSQGSLLGSPAFSKGSLTLPANSLTAGQILEFTPIIEFSGATSTIQLFILLGGTTVMISPAISIPSVTSFAASVVMAPTLFFPAVGSGGTVTGAAHFSFYSSTTAATAILMSTDTGSGTAGNTQGTVSVATNGSLLFDFQAKWGAQNSGNSIQVLGATLRSLN